jgi:4-hydroxy-tetrahydrodipicolinate synthase
MIFGKLITAMVTPFNTKEAVDYAEAVQIANYLADHGSDAIFLSGSTGESPTLTHEEEMTLFKEVKKGLKGKAKLLAGSGSNSTATAVEMTKKAEKAGMDGAVIVVPYYNKPTQEGLYQHFKTVAEATALPLMIYNIPSRTSRNMEPETVARLAEIKNYTSIKEASGYLEQMKKIIQLTPEEFLLYSGDDSLTLDVLKIGGVGVVSVASHLVGPAIKRMILAFEEGKLDEAEQINQELAEFFKIIFITTNPAPIKAALNMAGFKCGVPRLPLVDLNDAEKAKLKTVLQKYKLI